MPIVKVYEDDGQERMSFSLSDVEITVNKNTESGVTSVSLIGDTLPQEAQ